MRNEASRRAILSGGLTMGAGAAAAVAGIGADGDQYVPGQPPRDSYFGLGDKAMAGQTGGHPLSELARHFREHASNQIELQRQRTHERLQALRSMSPAAKRFYEQRAHKAEVEALKALNLWENWD